MDILANTYPDRNLTEPNRAAYRLGWTAPLYLADTSIEAWGELWPAFLRRYPAADPGVCAEQFHAAWYIRERTLLAATVEG
jgi:hypothetical protein